LTYPALFQLGCVGICLPPVTTYTLEGFYNNSEIMDYINFIENKRFIVVRLFPQTANEAD